ncbi:MAG: fluoride efflux transporter CrcB [Clostridium sp.]|uniref:fluoride efflux transporter CrcB n=1 Tax=Clostridium sp. TaxID=1506 RepID=UPI0029093020|nr:fluoride efflux transporter CrcB [Clostridium sp.]MDU7337242.1 fluoride efflux transporter CrcB [Clostridium sp.]
MNLTLVAIGGICGGLCRYRLGQFLLKKSATKFPLNTFIINLSGAFLLGVLTAFQPSHSAYLLLGDGFLGAYTTFSTFAYEGYQQLEQKNSYALFYLVGSLVLGVAAYLIGFAATKAFSPTFYS